MIIHLDHKNFITSNKELMNCVYHFSIAEYNDPSNINFGKLRVFNDEVIKPNGGFDLHLHRNLEILAYIIDGQLNHKDSLNNFITLVKGNLQLMSAGKGIYHSEINTGDNDLRLLQIWILPNVRNLNPTHSLINTNDLLVHNELIKVAGMTDAPLLINQDVNIYILKLDEIKEFNFEVNVNRQAYLVQIEGSSNINEINLESSDALKIIEENINIKSINNSHFVIIEMRKE